MLVYRGINAMSKGILLTDVIFCHKCHCEIDQRKGFILTTKGVYHPDCYCPHHLSSSDKSAIRRFLSDN